MLIEDAEKIISLIVEKTGKQKSEVQELIEKKKERFSGLLTDSGAAFLVAKELNADLELEKTISENAKVGELEVGARNADLSVKLLQCLQPRFFEKNERKGEMQNLVVGDDSGSIRLTLWNNQVKDFTMQKIEKGSSLLLKNCFVTEFNGRKQLNLGINGRIVLKERNSKSLKIEDLREGMQDVDIAARIARVFPEKKFSTNEKEGKLVNFEFFDGNRKARGTAWNEIAEELLTLEENDLVKFENAYIKKGKELELHLGWQARIIKNPKGIEIPKLEKTIAERKKIAELDEGRLFEIKAVITALHSKKPGFEVCSKCGLRVERMGEDFLCENCGKTKPELKALVKVQLDDGSARIEGIAFGREAEKIVEKSAGEMEKQLKEKSIQEVIESFSEKAVGKELLFQGIKRANKLSMEEEFVIKQVARVSEVE